MTTFPFPNFTFANLFNCNARQKLSKAGLRSRFLPFIQQLEEGKPTVEKMLPCLVRRERGGGKAVQNNNKKEGWKKGEGKYFEWPVYRVHAAVTEKCLTNI